MSDDEQCGEIKNDGEPCGYSAKHDDGKCGIHTEDNNQGRPSLLDEYEDDILAAAREGLTYEGAARVAGIGVSTLHEWRNEHEAFSESLERARAEAERELIAEADSEFVLERSYGYIKTEEHQVDMDADHTFDASEGVSAEFVSFDASEDGADGDE